MKLKGTVVIETTRERALSKKLSHVTQRQMSDVSWPGDIDDMLIYQISVHFKVLQIFMEPSDSTI